MKKLTESYSVNFLYCIQPIDIDKCKQPPGNRIATFQNTAGVENIYVQFGFGHSSRVSIKIPVTYLIQYL